jgi:hypothetical protein
MLSILLYLGETALEFSISESSPLALNLGAALEFLFN